MLILPKNVFRREAQGFNDFGSRPANTKPVNAHNFPFKPTYLYHD